MPERRTSPVELLWDLVFVFAVTQVTTLLVHDLSWTALSADEQPLDADLVAAVVLGLLATVGMWWTYFDRFAQTAEERLRDHGDPVLAAADGYSYLHLVIVAGIIVFAVGMKVTIGGLGEPLPDAGRRALCGGVALYLLGNAAFRLRMVGERGWAKLGGCAALAALFALGGDLSGLWVLAGATLVLGALAALDTLAAPPDAGEQVGAGV